MKIIVQKIAKIVPSDIQKAILYYTVISALNNLNLTRKQLELLAFTSVRGTITSPSARKEFISMFNSSLASLENIKNKLKRVGWLVEIDRKYRVNPRVNLDFSKDIILQINLVSRNDGNSTKQEVEKSPDQQNSYESNGVGR